MHGAGSSGTKSKKCVVAAACIEQPNHIERHETITCSITFTSKIIKMIMFSQTFHFRRKHKQRLRWSATPLSKTSGTPKSSKVDPHRSGWGAGRVLTGRRPVPKPWLRAAQMPEQDLMDPTEMKSHDCLRKVIPGQQGPNMSGSREASSRIFMKIEEKHGRINLPPKFGDQQHQGVTLVERWSDFGIPILFLLESS